MIKTARVSLSAVKTFEQAVSLVIDISPKLDGGITAIEQLCQLLTELSDGLNSKLSDMNGAINTLEDKIRQIEEILSEFRNQLNELKEELSDLKEELSNTDKTYTYTDSEGKEHEASNPEYEKLCERVESVEDDISSIEDQTVPYEQRLDDVWNIKYRLEDHIEETEDAIYSLEEKKISCRQLITELDDIKNGSSRKCNSAKERLNRIEEVISSYIEVKLVYDAPGNTDMRSNVEIKNLSTDTNINNPEKEYIDDDGKKYRDGDHLLSNTKFKIHGYKYETDDKGRVVSAEGKLRMRDPDYKRNMENVKENEGQEYKSGDDRGHLIGHQFGGSDKLENLVPMYAKLNQGDYVRLENTLKDAIVNDKSNVILKVEPVYEGDSTRPSEFKVSYSINGEKYVEVFRNESEEKI